MIDDLRPAVERAQAGDLSAFGEIYRILSAPLLSYLRTQVRNREDAEDLLGQIFIEAMRGIDRFEGGPGEFRAWLFRIGRDRAIDLARRLARRPEDPLETAPVRPADTLTDRTALKAIEREQVWQAVARLPEAQREVIALRLGAGLSGTEIAKILGKQINAIKALQHRALQNLARMLGTDRDEPGKRKPGVVPEGPESSLEDRDDADA